MFQIFNDPGFCYLLFGFINRDLLLNPELGFNQGKWSNQVFLQDREFFWELQ